MEGDFGDPLNLIKELLHEDVFVYRGKIYL